MLLLIQPEIFPMFPNNAILGQLIINQSLNLFNVQIKCIIILLVFMFSPFLDDNNNKPLEAILRPQ